MTKRGQQREGEPLSSSSSSSKFSYIFIGAIAVPLAAAIGHIMAGPNKHLSMEQRNKDVMFFVAMGLQAAVGLAFYLYWKRGQNETDSMNSEIGTSKTTTDSSKRGNSSPKDIWKVGESSQASLEKSKAAYADKPFGSKYYYAHNDSNTTGGYKDGLKMEDYRMNGPRLLSVNGKSVDCDHQRDDVKNTEEEEGVAETLASTEKNDVARTRITAQDPQVKDITKFMWDDPGNGKGIATIRVDVLPGEKFGEFVNFGDVKVKNVTVDLPGEGLLAKVVVSDKDTPSYQLKINKLYGDAADVKVIIKPKRLLIKVYKKKHGFLSKNNDNLAAWPQPHRKI